MRLNKFQKYFLNGEWHVHTNYTDGKNSVEEYCAAAVKKGIPLIAFTEHVRKELDYDFDKFVMDIKEARKKYPDLIILVGCETKVLDIEGNLDVSDNILDKCNIVLGDFHSFPCSDKKSYLTALKNMLKKGKIDVWAHPMLFAKKNNFNLSKREFKGLIDLCIKNGIVIEKNRRYKLPGKNFMRIVEETNATFINGGDIHSISEMRKMEL